MALFVSLLAVPLLGAPVAFAQDVAPTPERASIVTVDAPEQVRVGRPFIASALVEPGSNGTLRWTFGDGATSEGATVTHAFSAAGAYTLTATFTPEAQDEATVVATRKVSAAIRTALLFTSRVDRASERELQEVATAEGVALSIVQIGGHSAALLQRGLQEEIAARQDQLADTELLLFATPADDTLNALSALSVGAGGRAFVGKTLVLTDPGAASLRRLARIVTRQLGAERILLTDRTALATLLRTPDMRDAIEALSGAGVAVTVVDRRTQGPPAWALFSRLVDHLLSLRVSVQSILIILLIPVMIAVITFMRQIVGFATLGLFFPLALAISYTFTDIRTGLLLTVGLMGIAVASRMLLRKVRLLQMGRVGLATSFVVLSLLVVELAVAHFAPDVLPGLAILPILLIALTTERTYGLLAERGLKPSLLVLLENILVASVAAIVVNWWETPRAFLLAWPEAVLLVLLAQVLIGRYTGLRATEVLRFRDLLNEVEYAEEEE